MGLRSTGTLRKTGGFSEGGRASPRRAPASSPQGSPLRVLGLALALGLAGAGKGQVLSGLT
jgi:hypothetical protein